MVLLPSTPTLVDYGKDGDPTDSLSRYQASLEARCYGNMEEARRLWVDVMTRHGKQAQYWMEYAEIERCVCELGGERLFCCAYTCTYIYSVICPLGQPQVEVASLHCYTFFQRALRLELSSMLLIHCTCGYT